MIDTRASGFKQSGSLYVPDSLRAREVWTREEWKLLDRTTKLLASRGVSLFLGCDHSDCKDAPIIRTQTPSGTPVLRCNHLDRELSRV